MKPIVFNHFNSRYQLNLIDLQLQSDGEYKFIFVYQDHLTKFVTLRPLTSKRAEEVAFNLIDIFTTGLGSLSYSFTVGQWTEVLQFRN